MTDSLDRSFGLVIAFLLPGFLIVLGLQPLSPIVAGWFAEEQSRQASLGDFSYVMVSALAAGLVASAARWLLIDTALHRTGLVQPRLDFSRLQTNLQAFELAVQHNYRHYQFYANSAVGSWFLVGARLAHGTSWSLLLSLGFLLLQCVLLVTARDCLRRFYERIGEIIGDQ